VKGSYQIVKSPLSPLFQRGELILPLEKGGWEGFLMKLNIMTILGCHLPLRRLTQRAYQSRAYSKK
jgi:hypothetical protein